MENKKNNNIPEMDELEEESNHAINTKRNNNIEPSKVKFPAVEGEYTDSNFKADIAQQVGRFSDQVLMDSPAAEARTSGKDSIADIVEASEKKLAEKSK